MQEQQQLIEEENRVLVQELMSVNRSARGVESTMRELATLNQMFSTQVGLFNPAFCKSVNKGSISAGGYVVVWGLTFSGQPCLPC